MSLSPPIRVGFALSYPQDGLDLDGHVKWQRVGTDCAPRMVPIAVGEALHHEVTATVHNEVLRGEVR